MASSVGLAGLAAPSACQFDDRPYGSDQGLDVHGESTDSVRSLRHDASRASMNPGAASQYEPDTIMVASVSAMAALLCVLAIVLLRRFRGRRGEAAPHRGEPGRCEPSVAVPEAIGQAGSLPHAAKPKNPEFPARRCDKSSDIEDGLRELVFDFAHDLRTPLSGLQGNLETLAAKGLLATDEQRRYVASAQKQAARLRLLIEQLLEVLRLNASEIRVQPERFSLAELIQDTALEFRRDALGKGIDLSIDVGETAAYTTADISLIQRVIENLLSNAIHCSTPGGRVAVAIVQREDSLQVSVADDGPGIAGQHLPRIFERFYSSSIDEGAQRDSYGLGLAIARKILTMHGSAITVSSEVGAGARFEFELCLDKEVK